MKLSYTRRAGRQVDAILAEIAKHSPQGADSLADRISRVETLLRQFPLAGRTTTLSGIRRITVVPYPYVMDYRCVGDTVIVQRVRHAARAPPSDAVHLRRA